jgi:hypothetical protein
MNLKVKVDLPLPKRKQELLGEQSKDYFLVPEAFYQINMDKLVYLLTNVLSFTFITIVLYCILRSLVRFIL